MLHLGALLVEKVRGKNRNFFVLFCSIISYPRRKILYETYLKKINYHKTTSSILKCLKKVAKADKKKKLRLDRTVST